MPKMVHRLSGCTISMPFHTYLNGLSTHRYSAYPEPWVSPISGLNRRKFSQCPWTLPFTFMRYCLLLAGWDLKAGGRCCVHGRGNLLGQYGKKVSCARNAPATLATFVSSESIPLNGGLSHVSLAYAQDDCHTGLACRGFEGGLPVQGFKCRMLG